MQGLRRCMLLFAFAGVAVFRLLACGPGPFVGEAAFAGSDQLTCFAWSEAEDPVFLPLLSADEDLSAGYDARDREAQAELDSWARDWSSFLRLGDMQEARDLTRSMLTDNDPAGFFRQKVLSHISPDLARRSNEVQRYLGLMARAAALDAALDPWAPKEPGQNLPEQWQSLMREASNARDSPELPPFLQSRYAYLVLRAATQAGFPQEALNIYKDAFAGRPGSLLLYKAWSYAARAALQLGDTTQAAQWYLAILDQFPALQFVIMESLGSLNLNDSAWDAVTASLPPGHRRAISAFARALFDPHVETTRYIEIIDAQEPGSPQLTKLLIRSLRAIDDLRLPRTLAGFAAPGATLSHGVVVPAGPNAAQIEDEKLETLRSFVDGVIAQGKEWNPGLWYAASAHLALLLGRIDEAQTVLDAATPQEQRFSASGKGALAVERLLAALARARPDRELQPLVPDALAALDAVAQQGDTAPREAVFGALGLRRLVQGDSPRATLDFSVAGYEETMRFMLDMYSTPAEEQALKGLLVSPPDAESAAGASRFPFPASDLEYMRGVRLLRSGSFDEAAWVLGSLPASFWQSGPRKSHSVFDEQYGQTPMFSVLVANGDLNNRSIKPRLMRRDELARRLAELAKAGDAATLGWMYLSTPFIAYNDLLWNGEMIEVLKRASVDGGWPFVTRDLAEKATKRLRLFLDEYDSNAIASRYLNVALARQKAPETAAQLALGLWQSVAEPSYAPSAGAPTGQASADPNAVAAMIARKYGRTSVVRNYRSGFADGCPGLDVTR